MLQSRYLNENDLANMGFKSLGKNIRVSSDARFYGVENISIGDNVRVDDFVIFAAAKGFINIGSNVVITRNCHLGGGMGITMHDFSSMAANTVIYSSTDDYSGEFLTGQNLPQKYIKQTGGHVEIGRHVIIGAASVIIGNVKIGEGCSIGAMSLIIKSLEEWGVYVGTPVRRIKDRKKDLLKLEKQYLEEISKNQQASQRLE